MLDTAQVQQILDRIRNLAEQVTRFNCSLSSQNDVELLEDLLLDFMDQCRELAGPSRTNKVLPLPDLFLRGRADPSEEDKVAAYAAGAILSSAWLDDHDKLRKRLATLRRWASSEEASWRYALDTAMAAIKHGISIQTEEFIRLGHERLRRLGNAFGRDTGYLSFRPGVFIYRGVCFSLMGKPLQILRKLAEARHHTCTLDDLRRAVWNGAIVSEEAVRSSVQHARKALRDAMRSIDVDGPADPIPNVDRGTRQTAWRLDLP
jgi:hypothetical protein